MRTTIMNNTLALLLGFCALFLVVSTTDMDGPMDEVELEPITAMYEWPSPAEFLENVENAPYQWEPHDEPNQYPDLLRPVSHEPYQLGSPDAARARGCGSTPTPRSIHEGVRAYSHSCVVPDVAMDALIWDHVTKSHVHTDPEPTAFELFMP